MIPMPHQIEGALFLADRRFGILADEPRVGKTGAAIMACDYVMAKNILVVTTASGRAVWRKGFADWSDFNRPAQILTPKDKLADETRVAIVGWPSAANSHLRTQLLNRKWDVVVLDESHYAKNFGAKRTEAVFGTIGRFGHLLSTYALANAGRCVWCLSGSPMPNSPFDLYPMLRYGAEQVLEMDAARGRPCVRDEQEFKKRYCKTKPQKIGQGAYARYIDVIVGGRNLDELRERIAGLMLQRTQADVGITQPIYEVFPLLVGGAMKARFEAGVDTAKILAAIENGSTRDLEMHLGPLRRITGRIKADLVAEVVRDEFQCGLDKIVLAYWHRDVGAALAEALAEFGVTGIDGATPDKAREANVAAFSLPGGPRVFLAQIQAAGEAIDLSAAAEMMFVEMSFVPKDGTQMALRITNHNQTRQPRVRVAAVDGSIDEAIQQSLLRKVTTIREVMK